MSLISTISPITPADDVITVQQAKDHCNCDVTIWDNLFPGWIAAARAALQRFTNQAFLPSNVTLKGRTEAYSDFDNYIELPFANNAALTGDSATKYTITGDRIYTNDTDIDITYTAGTTPEEWMKQAVKMYVADLYENRGEERQDKEVGREAKQHCKAFVSHGMMF